MGAKASIEKLLWKDVREEVKRVNPDFAEAVDCSELPKQFGIWRVKYPFGTHILKDSRLQLPDEKGNFMSIDDPDVSPEIYKDLSYASNMPFGIILNKSIEVYLLQNKKIIPFLSLFPGRILSLWENLKLPGKSSTAKGKWQAVAGSHCIFMLPKLSDKLSYRRLVKKLNLESDHPPAKLSEHWYVFREISNSDAFETDWICEILFFSKEWLDSIHHIKNKWSPLRVSCLESLCDDGKFERDRFMLNYLLSLALKEKNLKPDPYLLDTLKHIYDIARGMYPGFKIASHQVCAPVVEIQTVFTEIYKLKFFPTMLHPDYIHSCQPGEGLYYSLELPTMFSFSPKSTQVLNKLEDLRHIQHLENKIVSYILEDHLNLKGTSVYTLFEKTRLEYYHSVKDSSGKIKDTADLLRNEPALLKTAGNPKLFCYASKFLNGCIRILVEK